MSTISNEAINSIKKDLEDEINRSWRNAGKNHQWNVSFRVVLLVIGILIVVCSSIASSSIVTELESKEYWSLASAILGGASTALAAFAFNQFNFEARQRLWLDRHSALKVVRDRMLLGECDARLFDDIAVVRSWHDFNPPAGETLRRLLGSQQGENNKDDDAEDSEPGDDASLGPDRPKPVAATTLSEGASRPRPASPARTEPVPESLTPARPVPARQT